MQLTKGSSHYNNVSNKPAEMANIKHNWNKYRSSRADTEIQQIAWQLLKLHINHPGGGGMHLIK